VKLYRVMKLDADGKPLIGIKGYMLGVRPTDPNSTDGRRRFDVKAVNPADTVSPGEGLSTSLDPTSQKVRTNETLFELESDALPAELREFPDHGLHCLVEPPGPMTLEAFQQALADTRDLWTRVQ